jgi:hypothetical protein
MCDNYLGIFGRQKSKAAIKNRTEILCERLRGINCTGGPRRYCAKRLTMAQGLSEVYICRINHQSDAHWESDFSSRNKLFACDDMADQTCHCIAIHHANTHQSSWLQRSVICRDFEPIQIRSLEGSCCDCSGRLNRRGDLQNGRNLICVPSNNHFGGACGSTSRHGDSEMHPGRPGHGQASASPFKCRILKILFRYPKMSLFRPVCAFEVEKSQNRGSGLRCQAPQRTAAFFLFSDFKRASGAK